MLYFGGMVVSTQEKIEQDKPAMWQNKRNKRSKWIKISLIAVLGVMAIFVAVGAGFAYYTFHNGTNLTGVLGQPASTSQIYDASGNVIAMVHAEENRVPVPIKKIPKDIQNAFVAAEDVRFYQHSGVDVKAIARAVWTNVTEGSVMEGGSTITQQLAKNALLTQERTLKRKITEAFLALEIERRYSKQEIMEMYLNQIYFGEGAYGVQTASLLYFGKNVDELNLAECAMLAGLPRRPSDYSPFNSMKLAKERQETVLSQMVKYQMIDQATAAKALNTPIKLAARKQSGSSTAPYFVDYVVQQMIEKYGADMVYKAGLKIYTTIDIDMQRQAEQALNSYLPTMFTDNNGVKQPQGALVALDPQTGYIKAMVGGRGNDQFNRAVLAERQPGSAFKPFVYLAALEAGISPDAIVEDKPTSFGGYVPQNYDKKFHGFVTIRTALEQSLNVIAVRLGNHVGPGKILEYAQKMGISTLVTQGYSNDQTLAMALGGLTRGVTPLDIASAYGVLANSGVRVEPTAIIKVTDREGRVLEENRVQGKSVVREATANLLVDMMRGVISRGTGAGANIGRPAAGKTGTTNDYQDAWFIGFTPNLVTSVWMGCDNNQSLPGVTGGDLPASIWRSFMVGAVAKLPVLDFPSPQAIIATKVMIKDGEQVTPDPKSVAKPAIIVDDTNTGVVPVIKQDDGKTDTKPDGKKPAAIDDSTIQPSMNTREKQLDKPAGKN